MIAPIPPTSDPQIADFWVQAWRAVFPEIDFEARRPWILEHLATMRASNQVVRAYCDDDTPVGFYTLFPASGLIEQICVSPAVAGRGIGGLLVGDAERHTAKSLNLVVNEDNKVARQFYVKLGFVETGRGVNEGSARVTIMMEKTAKTL